MIIGDSSLVTSHSLNLRYQPFLEATQRMSQTGRPLLHEVIQMIDLLERMLKSRSEDVKLRPIVRASASLGRDMLDKYYAKTDESIMCRTGIRTYPCYDCMCIDSILTAHI